MHLSPHLSKLVFEDREIGIADICFFDFRQIDVICYGQKLLVDARSSYDEYLWHSFSGQLVHHGWNIVKAFYAFHGFGGQNDISPVWQRPAYRNIGVVSHDNDLAGSDLLEMLQVFAVMPWQLVMVAYHPIVRHRCDYVDLHGNAIRK